MELTQEALGDGHSRLRLQGDCNIYSAGELKAALLHALAEPRATLELDLAGVTEIDTAGLQVLMAAKNFARAAGQQLQFAGHSAPVLELIEIYDLASWLGDPLIVPAAVAQPATH